MRKIANVQKENCNAFRLMICHKGREGVYVFGYDSAIDASCNWDCQCSTIEEAYEFCEDYGIQRGDWIEIENTKEFCQDDWIKPVRVKGRINGKPEWGKLEMLLDGDWIEI